VAFQIDGRRWTATQIVDAFASRTARRSLGRSGLFRNTVEAYYDAFGRSGRAPLLFGFPSPRHRRLGILQLGYDAMEPQPIRYLAREGGAGRSAGRRLLYRAEPSRDWEPRLDRLWDRVGSQYPVSAVRDADRALRRFAGHPKLRYHRFLIFPRLSFEAVGVVVFRSDGGRLRWVDLVWDHGHPGALEMASHLSGRLAETAGCGIEELWINGDPEGGQRLERLGFEAAPEPQDLVMVARAFDPAVDLEAMAGAVYVTMGDSDLV
jgi:hypothetical protein